MFEIVIMTIFVLLPPVVLVVGVVLALKFVRFILGL